MSSTFVSHVLNIIYSHIPYLLSFITLKPFTVNVKVYIQLERHLLFLFSNISESFLILSQD